MYVDFEDFAASLEAAKFNDQDAPVKEHIATAKTEMSKEASKKLKKNAISKKKSKGSVTLDDLIDSLCSYRGSKGSSKADKDFETRDSADKLVKGWNQELAEVEGRENQGTQPELTLHNDFDLYDHWSLTANRRTEVLNDQFEEFVAKVQSEQKDKEFEKLGTTSNEVVTVIGRLANMETDVPFTKNVDLINLSEENTSKDGMTKVTLKLDSTTEEYTIFEGQIVMVRGIPDNRFLNVIGIDSPPILKTLKEDSGMAIDGSISAFVFAGPYTFADSLQFSVLKSIVGKIREQQPHYAILTGPFLDITHNLVSEGELFYTNENGDLDCFEDAEFYGALKRYLDEAVKSIQTKIIIIPSLNDMVSLHPFPQPPLTNTSTENVLFYPNPARFSIEGIEFGVMNTDILRPLLGSMINTETKSHRLTCIMEQIIRQRSFFPLYPAPKKDVSVDVSQYQKYEMPEAPDVFIAVSEIPAYTAYLEGSSVLINPGFSTKGSKAGTYSCISIHRNGSADLKENVRVDIKSI